MLDFLPVSIRIRCSIHLSISRLDLVRSRFCSFSPGSCPLQPLDSFFKSEPHLGLAPPSSLLLPPAVLLRLPPPSSYNTPWALPWAEPWQNFLRGVHFVRAAPCLFCSPLPKPPSQLMRYLPPPSPTSPSQPLPPDPFPAKFSQR